MESNLRAVSELVHWTDPVQLVSTAVLLASTSEHHVQLASISSSGQGLSDSQARKS